MLVHTRDEGRVPAAPFNQRRCIVHDIELVRPLVALVRARPRAARVTRLHEARARDEDAEGQPFIPYKEFRPAHTS